MIQNSGQDTSVIPAPIISPQVMPGGQNLTRFSFIIKEILGASIEYVNDRSVGLSLHGSTLPIIFVKPWRPVDLISIIRSSR